MPRIPGEQLSAATNLFPDPKTATLEFIEGKAITVDGHEVTVTFRRQVIEHPRKTYYLWLMESARYVDDEPLDSTVAV